MRKIVSVFVIGLLIGICIIPSYSGNIVSKSTIVNVNGETLYVGGSGPNNYTTIQEAIDDAVDGDTVFVYDDSSPYYENIVIDKSINLIGEDRNTTVIESVDSVTISVQSDCVFVSGFKIKGKSDGIYTGSRYVVISENSFESGGGIDFIGGGENMILNNIIDSLYSGINIESSDNTVIGNTINAHSMGGIFLTGDDNFVSDNIIMNILELVQFPGDIVIFLGDRNIVSNNTLIAMDDDYRKGICLWNNNQDNIIERNTIIGYDKCGIETNGGDSNRIHHNDIDDCQIGIYLEMTRKNLVDFNEISNCIEGVSLSRSNFNTIENNNFLNNDKNALFNRLSISNKWDANYWDGPQDSQYVVKGKLFLFLIPWWNFDWNPAQEPYDIGV